MIQESFEELIEREKQRQEFNVELIASENFPSQRILNAAGSILTNKYAEGYPEKRYYGGCCWIDKIEQKAIDNACKLFDCKFANVQPHCGSSANQAVYRAFCKPGDTVIGMNLDAGGHLTHGHKLSFSGQDYYIYSYGVDENGILDYEDLEDKIEDLSPRMVIVGASAYSRIIDFKRIYEMIKTHNAEIKLDLIYNYGDEEAEKLYEEQKCIYMVDMAHIAGLVAAGVHPSPIPYADVITSTTHKTLRGPRGGLILWNDERYTNKINKAVFPGIQGGPLEHIIAAKGICFEEAMKPEFTDYALNVVKNSKAFSEMFISSGWKVVSNGTDNHLFILDIYNSVGVTGRDAEIALDRIDITVNKNQIPNDALTPLISSGVRIGTAAMTTKGWTDYDFMILAKIIIDYFTELKMENVDVPFVETKYQTKVHELVNDIRKRNEAGRI